MPTTFRQAAISDVAAIARGTLRCATESESTAAGVELSVVEDSVRRLVEAKKAADDQCSFFWVAATSEGCVVATC